MLLAILREIWNYGVQEFAMADQEKIDWSQCSLVEVDSLVLSGAPVLRGTRMPANAIVDNYDYGMSVAEISEQFEVPEESIRAILTQRAIALPILFDKNVPIGVRHFLPKHEVRTVVELSWPQKLQNGELLRTPPEHAVREQGFPECKTYAHIKCEHTCIRDTATLERNYPV